MRLKQIINCILVILICGTIAGCIRVKYPHRTQYMLNVKMPAKTKRVTDKILKLDDVNIAPQFSGLDFVYRTSDINYTSDYYNVFFNAPAQQIEQSILRYIQAKNIFQHVTTNSDIFSVDYVLHADVLELYADYRDSKYPKAVMVIHFILFHPNGTAQILLDKTYSTANVLRHKDARSLVYAWNGDLAKILAKLTNNLARLKY